MKVLVTGANGGIGSSIAQGLKGAGIDVVETTSKDTDLSKPEEVSALKGRVGQVDWVVCAHGFIDTEQVLEKERTEDIQATFDVNTLSLFWLAQAFLPDLQTGFLILSSSAGLAPNGRYAAYSASKAAANAFVQAMARNREHLKFIAVAPGPTNTEMRERIAGDAAKMQSPDTITAVVTKIVTGTSEYRSGDIVLVKDGVCSTASQV